MNHFEPLHHYAPLFHCTPTVPTEQLLVAVTMPWLIVHSSLSILMALIGMELGCGLGLLLSVLAMSWFNPKSKKMIKFSSFFNFRASLAAVVVVIVVVAIVVVAVVLIFEAKKTN